MTFDEVLDPVVMPIAFAIAVLSVLRLLWHVARRYPPAPKRVPTGIRFDGRPGRLGAKRTLWLAPIVIAITLGATGAALLRYPPRSDQHLLLALVMLLIAELAWFAAWTIDRQIELARKMTYRVAPSRTLRALLPIIATVIAIVFVGARP
ncbi:MAG TPA: hypothetical protein VIW69_11225 [Candidatus Elarobacter sp.]